MQDQINRVASWRAAEMQRNMHNIERLITMANQIGDFPRQPGFGAGEGRVGTHCRAKPY